MTSAAVEKASSQGDPSRERMLALAYATADGFRSLASGVDSGSADDVGGAVCWYSSSYVPLFNGAGLFDVSLINPDTLAAIDAYFAARERPYSIVTIDGLTPDASERLRRLNCIELEASPAMWLDGAPNRWEPYPPNLQMTRVQTPEELAEFRSILRAVFYISQSEVDLIMSDKMLAVPHVLHYMGRFDGAPAATLSLALTGPVAGIWNVGTLKEYRKRGAAGELVRMALADAAGLGYASSMLLSSPEGLSLYQRLGYETVSMVRMFVPAHLD